MLQPRENTFFSLPGKTSLPFPKCELNTGLGAVLLWVGHIPLNQWIWIGPEYLKNTETFFYSLFFSLKPLPHNLVSVYQAFLSLAAAQTLKTRALIYLYLELVIPVLALLFPLCPYFVELKMKRRNQVELCLVCGPCSVDRTVSWFNVVQLLRSKGICTAAGTTWKTLLPALRRSVLILKQSIWERSAGIWSLCLWWPNVLTHSMPS